MSDGHDKVQSKSLFHLSAIARILGIPLTAIFLAGLFGTLLLWLSEVNPFDAYSALFEGAFGNIEAFTRTLEKSTPLICSGLAVALGLNAGLFNIGAQGQLLFGALVAAIVGFIIKDLPMILHIPLALLTGALAGGIYSGIKGAMKAYTGAHEVITGIMLNYVAINFTEYIAAGPFRDAFSGNVLARTPRILETAMIPHLVGIPLGFLFATAVAIGVWLFFSYTVFGFEIKTTGQNIHAARYAGINVRQTIILTMMLSGMLAGLGGAIETQGVVYRFQPGFNVGLGFDGITVALLARTHPLGIIPSSLLLGAMRAGAGFMQFNAGVSPEIIDVIQALMLFFIAADMLLKRLIGIPKEEGEVLPLTTGWGKVT